VCARVCARVCICMYVCVCVCGKGAWMHERGSEEGGQENRDSLRPRRPQILSSLHTLSSLQSFVGTKREQTQKKVTLNADVRIAGNKGGRCVGTERTTDHNTR